MAPARPPQQQTCLGLLIVEARRQAGASPADSWRRINTCYGRTAAAADTAAPAAVDAAAAPASAALPSDVEALDLMAHHITTRKGARPDDVAVMSACLGRSVFEVTPLFSDEEAAATAGQQGSGKTRRAYAPPPACAGIELLQVLRAEQAEAAAAAAAPAAASTRSVPPRRAPAAATTTTTTTAGGSNSADELSAFARRFASRAEKNVAAMQKLLSDIGAGLLRSTSRED
jgi:hypothetical protein